MIGYYSDLMVYVLVVALPLVLTIWNIVSLVFCLKGKQGNKVTKFAEVFGILVGITATPFCFYIVEDVYWWQEIDSMSMYPPIAKGYFLTFCVLLAMGLVGYLILRFKPLEKQPPLVTVISISAVYVMMILSVVYSVQIFNAPSNILWMIALILPINILILFSKTILLVVKQKATLISNQQLEIPTSDKKIIAYLESYLKKAEDYPKLALILILPLLGVVVAILMIFGQNPDSLVAMWSDTAEWNLSTQIPPPRLEYDGHYLCTVAVCGTPSIVKPLWVGERRGTKILVNRQLAVANAFEQVIEEKAPKLHYVIRTFYDKTGYPISRHINSKVASNVTYMIMKPLEWSFVLFLYLFDIEPEKRISKQYRKAVR